MLFRFWLGVIGTAIIFIIVRFGLWVMFNGLLMDWTDQLTAFMLSNDWVYSDSTDFGALKDWLLRNGYNFIKFFLENIVFVVALDNVWEIGYESLNIFSDYRYRCEMMRFRKSEILCFFLIPILFLDLFMLRLYLLLSLGSFFARLN